MASRQLVIKTGVVKRLIKEVASYEREAADRQADLDKLKKQEGLDDADIRQGERVHAEAAKMIPESSARLTKAAEELRELLGEAESTLSESKEYKDADSVLNQYYELDNGKLVMEGESEPKDIREDDY